MLKVSFENAEALAKGIELLAQDLGILVAREGADLAVNVCTVDEDCLCVTLSGNTASIAYGGGSARFFRGLATLIAWVKAGERERTVRETPLFVSNGAMVDMSRNAVMNLQTVKLMMRKMALMGMNTYMLYTEDTYEIEERPYFGYMRGRYTAAEIRELDAYAIALGIELVPCIQTLGHLATMLRWAVTKPYKDTSEVLLTSSEETYRLIEDMLKTIKANFTFYSATFNQIIHTVKTFQKCRFTTS